MNGWIKVHRSLTDHEVFYDEKAFRMFMWLLANCDRKTGTYTAGRIQLANYLKINSSTVYKILKRLEKKYNLVTLESNSKFTKISLINWAKYQSTTNEVTQSGSNKVTAEEQQSNSKVTLNKNRELRIKNKEVNTVLLNKKFSSFDDLTDEVLEKISLDYNVPIGLVRLQKEKMNNWLGSKGKTYKDYNLGLRNWVLDVVQKTAERGVKDVKYKSIDASGL